MTAGQRGCTLKLDTKRLIKKHLKRSNKRFVQLWNWKLRTKRKRRTFLIGQNLRFVGDLRLFSRTIEQTIDKRGLKRWDVFKALFHETYFVVFQSVIQFVSVFAIAVI